MHTFIQPLTEGKIITRSARMDDMELVALSEELGEPVSQLQTGFFPDPEFTVCGTHAIPVSPAS